MIFNGEATNLLIDEYINLIENGVQTSDIIFLTQNSNKKNYVRNEILEKTNLSVLEKLEIHSFYGFIYNSILDNWANLENITNDNKTQITPNLIGLEISQFILKDIIKDLEFKGYNSKKSLLHQLFRRYSLIVQNNLSEKDVDFRANVLGESFAPDAKDAINSFNKKTFDLRSFDYLRQALIFAHLYKKTDCFKNIKYIFIDNADEITPLCLDFIKSLNLEDIFIAYDKMGSSRCGYLSADKTAVFEFEKIFNQKAIDIPMNSKLKNDAENLFSNVINQKYTKLEHFELKTTSKRAKSVENAISKIKFLLNNGISPNKISIITPIIDDMLKFSLTEAFNTSFCQPLFLSGSEKQIENPLVKSTLTILKLADDNLKNELSSYDLRIILQDILGIPIKYCQEILEKFDNEKNIIEYNFKDEEHNTNYKAFLNCLDNLKTQNSTLSENIYIIAEKLFDFRNYKSAQINKFNFFIKQIEDFENVFGQEFIEEKKAEIINQTENSIIAENPYSILEIGETELITATPQKIIDNSIKTDYQIWLDVSSDEWIKSDTGPLYNSWVMQAGWQKSEYTIEDNIELSLQKTARILRKLALCSNEKIYTYSSLFDGVGVENFGGIEKYLKYQDEEIKEKIKFKIVPRDDQKPVLDYKSGKMAISAVPGAGKTTILLELILKLLKSGEDAENIFVLTYMESAARNFRERIKNADIVKLPNISTIHGLALKILKENSNFEKLGLNSDFEICDDSQRGQIIQQIASALKLKPSETETFERAVSTLKFSLKHDKNVALKTSSNKKINAFLEFYKKYQQILDENNLIDYDDMLLYSVKLLEENSDILSYYQEICKYIIEDEAQDSSAIQQRLLELLSAKHKNLIRCGDVNQAITTTFSNADVEGFRKFITEANSVEMNCSQRCSKKIYELANNLILWAESKPSLKNLFYKIFMQPVKYQNPEEKNGIYSAVLENSFAERNFIIKQIREIFNKDPKATIGILLRGNYQVKTWTNVVNNLGFTAITRTECLEQKAVFQTIFAILKIIQNPFDNQNIIEKYNILCDCGHYKKINIPLDKNFVNQNPDEIDEVELASFYWDIIYWLSFSALPIEDLAIKIGLHYYSTEIEQSNVYLISTLIKRIATNNNFNETLNRLETLSQKSSLSGFKFFAKEDEDDKDFMAGKVQIMTIHKSKGDEFDYVFLPEFAEKSFPTNPDDIKLTTKNNFTEEVKSLNPNYKQKDEFEMKRFLIAENLRLIYVAITRAKRKLFITVSKNIKTKYGDKTQEANAVIKEIIGIKS